MTVTGGASGLGSWPGESPIEAARTVFGLLSQGGIPYLPELPARGPGADMIGRGASMLVELPVDLQPSGWRFVDRPGRDQHRADRFLNSDLDALAEVAHEYTGPLKVQVCGPWTLMSGIDLQRGERTVADPGARRDLVESLAEGVLRHVEVVRRQAPAAQVVVQLDEPSLPAVLAGRLPTQSGVGRLRAVEVAEAAAGLRTVLAAAKAGGASSTLVHCCARNVPFPTLRNSGADAVAVDLSLLGPAGWESVAVSVEDGQSLWAGVAPTTAPAAPPAVTALVEGVVRPWRRVGLPAADLGRVIVTPGCGLAGASPDWARRVTELCSRAAAALAQEASA